ncbi:IpaD/SipD/SspD family type III secretion system needle tip protein [Morganella morganii]|uniref:IpaD/SipD/SspD family type III secretion system needle tip protein n=1 Tax=Morganella morganii TaxID=582 RepID=UPI003308EA04|nr:IpaD/SipD/SspD family type III secretion system needle tip protein [Morganella morganii]
MNEEWELDHGKINSYNTIMDGIKKELQMTLDEFSQRYNTINSNYDNMLRVITTMISELTQELKGFLRI